MVVSGLTPPFTKKRRQVLGAFFCFLAALSAQAFNSVAYIIGPVVGGAFILGKHQSPGEAVNFNSLLIR